LAHRFGDPGLADVLLKQRTRWNQGFLLVYRKKDWKQLPTLGQRLLARYTLMTPFMQAFTGLVIPLNVAIALFLDVPVGVAFITFLPAVTALVTFVCYVVPHWYDGARTAVTTDANAPYKAASQWLATEVENPERTRVLVDDALWLDLVHHGYRPGLGVIWFYKADLDPAVTKTMPRGWKDLDYVVASPTVRRDAADLPNVKAAMEHSAPVATFGTGPDRIEIRQIQTTAGGT
jgi:hypothetical protein